MSHARYIVGDVHEVLATLEPGSVDLVMTSPPFLALRSYLPADHPDKCKEIGSEATPGEFIDAMLDVVEACDRVLAPHGSLVFELGDTYAGSGGAGGDYAAGGLRDGAPGFTGSATNGRRSRAQDEALGILTPRGRPGPEGRDKVAGWPLDKSKVLIPQLFAVALAYGFNPLTGRTTEPWRVRNTVAWARPNPPVGRDGDKFRPATSFLTVACKARDRYWDGDAVRTAHSVPPETMSGTRPRGEVGSRKPGGDDKYGPETRPMQGNPAGAPLLDWWAIPTAPYKGSHYATYPPDLVVPIVKSMCPQRVCNTCGVPRRRITERTPEYAAAREAVGDFKAGRGRENGLNGTTQYHDGQHIESAENVTVGWSECHCDDPTAAGLDLPREPRWRTGVVLDPFAGSGTTLQVATGHGFDAVGVDLDERNADLARERVGMFLSVEYPERVA